MRSSPGMAPGIGDYVKYAFYMIFAPHTPIVNMAGDPSKILDREERIEAETRSRDPLLVKYISMYVMMESKYLLDNMVKYAGNSNCPLLLLYGSNDSIVEKSGCDEIYRSWKSSNKEYKRIENGPHGKLTVIMAKNIIHSWLNKI
jgi:alpha-beta hydrolase superfamily lysophospholipase